MCTNVRHVGACLFHSISLRVASRYISLFCRTSTVCTLSRALVGMWRQIVRLVRMSVTRHLYALTVVDKTTYSGYVDRCTLHTLTLGMQRPRYLHSKVLLIMMYRISYSFSFFVIYIDRTGYG